MAKLKNVTADTLTLFTASAPPCESGDTVTVSDARFVGRAWPKSTWDLVKPPVGFDDASTDDAWLYIEPQPASEPEPSESTPTRRKKD